MTERPWGSKEPAGGFTLTEPRPAEPQRNRSFLRELPVLLLVALALATMEPGDRVLVRKVLYGPHRGEVIVFSDPKGRPGPDRGIVGGSLHRLSLGIEQPEHKVIGRAFAIAWPPSRVGWIH